MDKGKVGHRQKAFNGAGTSWEAGMNEHTYILPTTYFRRKEAGSDNKRILAQGSACIKAHR